MIHIKVQVNHNINIVLQTLRKYMYWNTTFNRQVQQDKGMTCDECMKYYIWLFKLCYSCWLCIVPLASNRIIHEWKVAHQLKHV